MKGEKYFKQIEDYLLKVPRQTRVHGQTIAHVGALIVYRGCILALGHNQLKSHPLQADYKNYRIYLHAEMDALRKALRSIGKEELAQCYLYVLRLKRGGRGWIRGCAKPCNDCMVVLVGFGLQEGRILWTM